LCKPGVAAAQDLYWSFDFSLIGVSSANSSSSLSSAFCISMTGLCLCLPPYLLTQGCFKAVEMEILSSISATNNFLRKSSHDSEYPSFSIKLRSGPYTIYSSIGMFLLYGNYYVNK